MHSSRKIFSRHCPAPVQLFSAARPCRPASSLRGGLDGIADLGGERKSCPSGGSILAYTRRLVLPAPGGPAHDAGRARLGGAEGPCGDSADMAAAAAAIG